MQARGSRDRTEERFEDWRPDRLLTGLLATVKSLALAYDRDLQEDKHFVFDSADTVTSSLKIMTGFISTLKFQRERMSDEADADLTLLATDLADVLVRAGMPFRRAHEIVGEVVRYSLEHDKRLQDLTDTELKRFSKDFPKGTAMNLSVHHSVHGKMTAGGTSPQNVSAQAAQLKAQASQIRKYLSHL